MATKTELFKASQELNTKTPLLYQGEVYDSWVWFKDTKFKEPNTRIDFKITLIKEALNIWNNQTFNIDNINKMFDDGKSHNWDTVLKSWLEVKKTGKLPDGYFDYYIKDIGGDKRAIPEIYEDWNDYITELDQTKTKAEGERDTAQTSLKTWTDTFPNKKPSEVKTEYDNLKEQHTADQLEKPKPEDSKISDQKKGPFLTYLHTRPVFSKLYKEIKKLGSVFNVDLLHVTDDKNEFLKNLSEYRFNLLLWEWKSGYWSVLWTEYRDKFDYYTDTDVELEVDQEEAQIKKFFKGESFEHQFFHWGIDNSAEGKTKQGFATVAIETILKRIKDNPKLAMSEKIKEGDLKLPEDSADIAQKEYDVYLEQLNQKDQKDQKISQIEVGPLNK